MGNTPKGKTRLDAAVEWLVRQAWNAGHVPIVAIGAAKRSLTKGALRAIITEAYEMGRQSAARECAEIADSCLSARTVFEEIQRHFGMAEVEVATWLRERAKGGGA